MGLLNLVICSICYRLRLNRITEFARGGSKCRDEHESYLMVDGVLRLEDVCIPFSFLFSQEELLAPDVVAMMIFRGHKDRER